MLDTSLLKGSRTAPENFSEPDLVLILAPGWATQMPPLSLAMLAAYLRKNSLTVVVLDLNILFFRRATAAQKKLWRFNAAPFWFSAENTARHLNDQRQLLDEQIKNIIARQPLAVGFSCYYSTLPASLYLAKEIKKKEPRIKIIFGGPAVNVFLRGQQQSLADDSVDYVVQGEGESALLELIQNLKAGNFAKACQGVLFKQNGKIIDPGQRSLLADLQDLPHIDFSDFKFSAYEDPVSLPLITSRGCVNNCIYCTENLYQCRGSYRAWPAERIIAEIVHQKKLYPQIDNFIFQDALINGNLKELEKFADMLIAMGLKIRWTGYAVVRQEMTLPLLKKLKQSGCFRLAFGVETASPELMLRIGKNVSRGADLDLLVRDCHNIGLDICLNFMFGLPTETEEDFAKTIAFITKNKKYIPFVYLSENLCVFYPGTLAAQNPKAYDLDLTKGEDYWESLDGQNNYPARLEKFETFRALLKKLKIPPAYPYSKVSDKSEKIAKYKAFCQSLKA